MEDFTVKPFSLKILRSGWHITRPQAQQTKDFSEFDIKKMVIYIRFALRAWKDFPGSARINCSVELLCP
jgi:hypothetical protein